MDCTRFSPSVLFLTAIALFVGQAGAQDITASPDELQEPPLPAAQLQGQPNAALPQTQPAASLIDQLRQAQDVSTAISLYADAAKGTTDDAAVKSAFIRKMIDFGMPALAEHQASEIVARNSNDGVAWAVLADAAGRRGETANALTDMANAIRLSPNDQFVQQTAGKLLAWFDAQASPTQKTDQMKSAAESVRNAVTGRDAYTNAYQQAVAFYREQQQMQASAQQQTQSGEQQQPQQAQPPQETEQNYYSQGYAEGQAQPSPESTDYYSSNTYNTYNTYPQADTYAYSTPYAYGYTTPYYGGYAYGGYPYYSGYYGYADYWPTYYYGGYTWPYYSPVIVAPYYWPRYRHDFYGFDHRDRFYPHYYDRYGGHRGDWVYGGRGYDRFGFTDRFGYGDRYGYGRWGSGSRGGIDRYTSPSIPRGVAQDWARGRTASPSISRGTFDRGGIRGQSGIAANVPRGTFNRGQPGITGSRAPRTMSRQGSFNQNYGYVSPSVPRSSTIRPSPGISGRAPSSMSRSVAPRSSISRGIAPSRSMSMSRSPGMSRGFSGSRSFSAPRSSGRMSSPSMSRGGFSRGGGGFARGGGGGGFARGGGGGRGGGRR